MKTSRFLLAGIIFITVYISACKKDSSEHSDIIGKWKLTHLKASLANSKGILDTLSINATHGDYIDLRANGKFYSNSWIGISFISPDHKISFTNTNVQSIDTGFYQIVNDKIIVSNEMGEKDTLQILQLTSNQLILDWNLKLIKDSIPIDYNNFLLWDIQSYYKK